MSAKVEEQGSSSEGEATDGSHAYDDESEIRTSDVIKRRKKSDDDEGESQEEESQEDENDESQVDEGESQEDEPPQPEPKRKIPAGKKMAQAAMNDESQEEEESEEDEPPQPEPKRKIPAGKKMAQAATNDESLEEEESEADEPPQTEPKRKVPAGKKIANAATASKLPKAAIKVPKAESKKAAKTDARPPSKPHSYEEMVLEAIESNGKFGMTLAGLNKYLASKYNANNKFALKRALNKALADGHLKRKTGVGLTGTFLIDPDFGKKEKKALRQAAKDLADEKRAAKAKKREEGTKVVAIKDKNNNAKAVISKTTKIKNTDGNVRLSIGSTKTMLSKAKKTAEPKGKEMKVVGTSGKVTKKGKK